MIYQTLERSFGEEGAQAYGAANEAGLAQIVRFSEELGIECDLERKPAYVYSRSDGQLAEIEKEAEVARRLGLPASFFESALCPSRSPARSASTIRRSSIRANTCSGWRRPYAAAAERYSKAPARAP